LVKQCVWPTRGRPKADPKLAPDPKWASDPFDVGAISAVVKGRRQTFRRQPPLDQLWGTTTKDGGSEEPPP
jgi:hypothetical protein